MQHKQLALIAHDGKKADMIAFVREHRAALERLRLIGTATTARLIREETGLPVESVLSGPLGGDVQIAAGVATGEVGAVIFLVDPLNAHPHDPDIQAVLRVCNVHNVPLATNLATARLLLSAQTMDQE
jgi:methylglyoxal synthase